MEKTVIELFAGVGGFRVGLNNVKLDLNGNTIEENNFKFVWANQWEPSTKTQDAFNCYTKRFGVNVNHTNVDITTVDKSSIPDHSLLVGGFPCQDYSVARSLSNEKGIEGKKGVLWWQISDILNVKKTPFLLLENVDRLIKSPSKQRGRDFGIMLKCLDDLGYAVEWRVINAADYGHPQKRRRVYIFGYHKSTNYYKKMKNLSASSIFNSEGLFAKKFPVILDELNVSISDISKNKYRDLIEFSNNYSFKFENAGYMINGSVYSKKISPIFVEPKILRSIIQLNDIPQYCYLNGSQEKFKYLKGHKSIPREKNGIKYNYSEGSMSFPDSLDLPGRTMLTSEGTVNRSTHVIKDINTEQLRLITPIEAERLNQFPDNWTNTGMSYKRRYFMMGNALVCGIIQKIGTAFIEEIII